MIKKTHNQLFKHAIDNRITNKCHCFFSGYSNASLMLFARISDTFEFRSRLTLHHKVRLIILVEYGGFHYSIISKEMWRGLFLDSTSGLCRGPDVGFLARGSPSREAPARNHADTPSSQQPNRLHAPANTCQILTTTTSRVSSNRCEDEIGSCDCTSRLDAATGHKNLGDSLLIYDTRFYVSNTQNVYGDGPSIARYGARSQIDNMMKPNQNEPRVATLQQQDQIIKTERKHRWIKRKEQLFQETRL